MKKVFFASIACMFFLIIGCGGSGNYVNQSSIPEDVPVVINSSLMYKLNSDRSSTVKELSGKTRVLGEIDIVGGDDDQKLFFLLKNNSFTGDISTTQIRCYMADGIDMMDMNNYQEEVKKEAMQMGSFYCDGIEFGKDFGAIDYVKFSNCQFVINDMKPE